MEQMDEMLKDVGGDLKTLIDANQEFRRYREVTVHSLADVTLKGPLGLSIDSRTPLGLSLYPRGQ
ncbi:hypothetical protein GOC22_25585 [Sinorhizobium meliloti]|nr:hypothetical protein [Sinorhizobium meliloti]